MMKRFGIMLVLIGLTGCLGSMGPTPPVRLYVLEYAPPGTARGAEGAEMLKVERFSAARLLAGSTMLYRSGPFRVDAYHGDRWRVPPAEMVEDYLRRDLRHAGIFRAVLSARDAQECRFALEGGVDDFLEVEETGRRKALLGATITLVDLSQPEVSGRVRFQKTYRCEAMVKTPGAAGFAEAMSSAMAALSTQVIADVGVALKGR